ncbi:uncharacterized protein LOC128674260 [Plodia interpunctella]|uniref:uncharacterized protein LOC128674260 n=1 Tax=Plodia interpunctella TaxID=58824 RepID=UPI0023682F33|nr:uncharacterized protein LOC128674260 [Plodia interpunctella]XP_053608713.1 uncharacterized protein LOC128674260 [Plodia interpunctella]XP_053608714.1 uncharacterized protein LOC128674260 [Plodia interpunctella]
MDQISPTPSAIPQIVQVYPPANSKIQSPHIIHISHQTLQSQGKVAYQQSIAPKPLHIPVSSHLEIQNQMLTQDQIVLSCQQAHLQELNPPLQAPMHLRHNDMGSTVQITSHVILPQMPVFKQHVLVNGVQQQYYEYDPYQKEESVAESDPEVVVNQQLECKTESSNESYVAPVKRTRGVVRNPERWACNIRKMKHQRGEAYISRRGKYVPERKVRNMKDCLQSCKYKCNEKITDTDREHIFKAFYSLNANEKKHFLLNTTERNYVKHKMGETNHRRKYSFKYFFLVRAVRYTVCKNFYLGTLAISQKPVYNVHLGKSEMNIPKPDGRGLSEASTHSLPPEAKERVRQHIMSFNTVDSKPIKQYSKKKQYLETTLTIKQMYNMYFTDCSKENSVPVKESMYRKILKQEFNLHFKKIKNDQELCCKCKGVIKKKS